MWKIGLSAKSSTCSKMAMQQMVTPHYNNKVVCWLGPAHQCLSATCSPQQRGQCNKLVTQQIVTLHYD